MSRPEILVSGSREWTDWATIYRALVEYPPGTLLIQGACPTGADRIAHHLCRALGFEERAYPADWKSWGRAAGGVRNSEMLDKYPGAVILAFPLPQGVGTQDLIKKATWRQHKVRVFLPT